MPYMLLILEPTGQRRDRGEAEGRVVYERMLRFADDLQKQGVLLASQSLAGLDSATRVQVRGAKAQVLDGPFAETKEMIGGFFLIDCKTREEAVTFATQCPAAQWCTVEVRPLAPCYEGA